MLSSFTLQSASENRPWLAVRGLLLLLGLALAAPPAAAQYMFLDANGDGVNNASDVLAPGGTTTLAVWLRTDANRDGGATTCATGEDLTINSYEFILKATNGKIAWGTFTNLQPDMTVSFGLASSDTEYHNGFGGGVILPPGTYQLATLDVSVALGTPAISIAAASSLSGVYLTSFGSQCSAQDFDNTMKLGADWFDADGVAYGGAPQSQPVLAPIADMTVDEGATASQTITATDADQQPLEFTKVSGPAFMTLTTTETGAGTGQASARIDLAPGVHAAGASTGSVAVSDGASSDTKSFAIQVIDANTAGPSVFAQASRSLPIGADFEAGASATDPDGDRITLSMVQRPSYVLPYLFGATEGLGGASGIYYGHAATADAGEAQVIFEATDGVVANYAKTVLVVSGTSPAPAPPADLFDALYTVTELTGPGNDIAMGDLDGDGDDDAAIASVADGGILVYASDRRGGLNLLERVPAGSPRAVIVADLDRDGADDVLYADDRSGDIVLLRGPFTGNSAPAQTIRAGARPVDLALGDLDRDGWLDVVAALQGEDAVAILRNDGTGRLLPPTPLPSTDDPVAVAIGDFNADSWLDIAAVCKASDRVNTWLATGAGSFAPPVLFPAGRTSTTVPIQAATLVLGSDGRSDLLITGSESGVAVFNSRGDGTYDTGYSVFGGSSAIAIGDVGGNGQPAFVTGTADALPNLFSPHAYVWVYAPGTPNHFKAHRQAGGPIAGIALGDVDADGTQDVVALQTWHMNGVAAVYRNQGAGRLGAAVVTQASSSRGKPAISDFDNDRNLDLVLDGYVFLGKGDGSFQAPILVPGAYGEGEFVAADLNRDGRQDFLQVVSCCRDVEIYLGDGTGHFVPGPQPVLVSRLDQHRSVALADLNEDEIVDLVIGNGSYSGPTPNPMELWLGRGDGSFAPPVDVVPVGGTDLRVRDLDTDGHLDLVYTTTGAVWVARGHGDATFDPPTPVLPVSYGVGGFEFGDRNGDGRTDIVVTASWYGTSLRTWHQLADGAYSDSRAFWTIGTIGGVDDRPRLFDADGDGFQDLLANYSYGLALGMGESGGTTSRRRVLGPGGGHKLVADMDGDGWLDIVSAGGAAWGTITPIVVMLNNSAEQNRREARAFLTGSPKTIPIGATGRDLCVRLEAVGGSYANADLDPASLVMRSNGTGSVSWIAATPAKRLVQGDSDGNGVEEIGVCFAAADLDRLFSTVQGRRDVPVVIEGRFLEGPGRLHAEAVLTIVHAGTATAPSLSPNPLNPAGVFRFATTKPGPVRIQLFDVQGRLLRTLVDRPLPPGDQEVLFDGKDRAGRSLASGVYFARVETVEGRYRMRVAIVK